jgi:hypothetical protein
MWPRKLPSAKDASRPTTIGNKAIGVGNTIATKLQHLITHATEPLPLSDGGQQGMSVRLVTDISRGFVEAAAPPVAGSKAMEMAIKAAKIVRAKAMDGLSGDMD